MALSRHINNLKMASLRETRGEITITTLQVHWSCQASHQSRKGESESRYMDLP